MKRLTLEECKEIFSYYVCTNGNKLGSLFFKAHIKEENLILPESISNIDNFIHENIEELICETKSFKENIDLKQLKFDLLKIKLLNYESCKNQGINEIIEKWVKEI